MAEKMTVAAGEAVESLEPGKKSNRKRILTIALVFICAGLWLWRYISLNGGLVINDLYESAYYEQGDIVEFGDNLSSGKKYYSGYMISVDSSKIYNSADYMEMLGKTEEDFDILIPDKVIEITVTLYNENKAKAEDESYTDADGIYFSSLELVGTDWYEYYNREFTAYANEIYEDDVYQSYGIIVEAQSSYTMKLIYNLDKRERTDAVWAKIEEEEMYLEITIRPVDQFIKLSPE
ncbi:MAG: hypothetical protein LUI10_10810 [Lachnospiraceae bacterium]|nr:hypothetical protein [Lachnospiraceae bacterium]